jgi:iron(III) transport system permease protein
MWSLFAFVIGFAIIWPIAQLQIRAFADGGSAFTRMLALPRFGETMWTTIYLAVGSTIVAVVIGVGIALAAAHLPRRVRTIGQTLPLLPLLVPGVAAVTGWMFLASPTVGYLNGMLRMLPGLGSLTEGPIDVYTVPAIVLLTGVLLSSFVYLFVYTGLQNMGQEPEAAAATCGASPMRALFTITIPLLRPSIVFGAGVVFLLSMGQFIVPLLLGRTKGIDVLTTEMFRLVQVYPIDYGLGAALGTPILIAGLIFVALQKIATGEQRRFVVVSGKSRYQPRVTSWWAAAILGIYVLVTSLLPLLALVYVSLSPFWSPRISFQYLSLDNYRTVFGSPVLAQAIWNSVSAALMAVGIVLVVGFICAIGLLQSSRAPRPLKIVLDILATLPLAVPASLMGFGLLFAFTGPPVQLYGTLAALIVTYVILMFGYSTRLQLVTLIGSGSEFREASESCGAGPLRTLFLVVLPMARKGIAAAVALVFVLMFHEFSASMMVRSPASQVIGSVMYDVWAGGTYPEMAVLALVMVAVTFIGVLIAVWIGGVESLKRL